MRPLPAGRLSKRVVTAWRISAVISTGVLAVMLVAATLAASSIFLSRINAGWLLAARGSSALLLVLNVLVVPAVRYTRWRYEVTDTEIDIFKGLIVHKRVIIPLVRRPACGHDPGADHAGARAGHGHRGNGGWWARNPRSFA